MLTNLETLVNDNIRILKIPADKLAHPIAIILVGFPGAGKTTLVKQLSEEFPLAVLSEEAMSHFLLPYKATFLEHSQEEFLELASATMEKLIEMGVSCIYDASIKHKDDRRIIKSQVELAGGRLLMIYLKIPREIALRRIEEENLLVSRGEKKGFILSKELFDYDVSSTQAPTHEEYSLTYETDKPENFADLKNQISQILSRE